MIEDIQLSPNFSLFELTHTDSEALQSENRNLTEDQVEKLRCLAVHCEAIRAICGNSPVKIHSGYRSPGLNGATIGSSRTSQHPKCEAVDFDVPGQPVEDSFNSLLCAAREGRFKFGQLILEQAERSYGLVKWCHCSLAGTLDPKKVGQVMLMKSGSDGHPAYTLVDYLKFK